MLRLQDVLERAVGGDKGHIIGNIAFHPLQVRDHRVERRMRRGDRVITIYNTPNPLMAALLPGCVPWPRIRGHLGMWDVAPGSVNEGGGR